MSDANPEKKARSKVVQAELNSCRERLRLLEEGKVRGAEVITRFKFTSPTCQNGGSYWTTIDHTHSFLSKLDGIPVPGLDTELLNHVANERDLLKSEIEHLGVRARILKGELENIWQDETEVAYELTSVFIHRGSSPSWGHYFFYSRHLPDSPDSWFKYNDSDVTVVSKDEVLGDTTGSTANPYLVCHPSSSCRSTPIKMYHRQLVYARKGSEVVDTVKRFDPNS